MTPRLLLTLWRERWGKAGDDEPTAMYQVGPRGPWGWRFIQASAWAVPGVSAAVTVLALALLTLACSINFSLTGQVAFSALLLGAALYLRRQAGTMASFVLLGLSFTVTARYLVWRLETMLGPQPDLSFALSFALWAAELHLACVLALRLTLAVWPLHRPAQALPLHRESWPTVDMFVLCGEQPPAMLEQMFKAAQALKWPADKIQLYFIDLQGRPELRERAGTLGAIYLSGVGHSRHAAVEDALHHSQGALIAIVDGATSLPGAFLRQVVGWFVRDPRLALVHSPHHFLAPAPLQRCLQALPSRGALFSCALVRRSSWLDTLVATSTDAPAPVLGLQLLDQGNGCACFGQAPQIHAAGGTTQDESTQWLRVDQPYSNAALAWRQSLAALYGVLSFHLPVAGLVVLTAPLAYLLFGVHVIPGTLAFFAAYAVPHWLHVYVAWSRAQGSRRRTVPDEIRDLLLSGQLLVITACTFLRTELSRRLRGLAGEVREADKPPVDRGTAVALGLWVGLNLWAMGAGIMQLPQEEGPQRHFALLYLLWAVYNVLVVAARAAVAQEARHIRWHTNRQFRKPVMIRLPHGRTLACTTQNFPSTVLDVALPTRWDFARGSILPMLVLRDGREQGFEAEVLGQRGHLLRVRVTSASLADYSVVAGWVHSRGEDWPQWLPTRDADRLVPIWLYRLARSALAALQFASRFFSRR